MVNVSISLIGANGDTIQLGNEQGDYILTTGVSGFGIPPTRVRIVESASNGGVWRNSKRGVRDIDLPIAIFGSDRQDVETKLRRLARLLQDQVAATKIRASYSDGTAYELNAHYVGGADVTYGNEANSTMAKWVIQMQAPQPFWESVEPFNYTLAMSAGRGLLPQLSKMKLSGQFGFGSVTLTNPGDVSAFPVWVITGPVDSITITQNGVGFVYQDAVDAGETVTIDTFAGTVRNNLGQNKYGSLAPAPKLFAVGPGVQSVTIEAPGSTTATRISGNFKERREVLY